MAYVELDCSWIGLLKVTLAAVLVVGCGADGDGDEAAESGASPAESVDVSTLDDPEQARDLVYAEAYCGCYWESDEHDDEAACIAANDGFATQSCIAEALFGVEEAQDRLQCLYDAAVAEAECIAASGCGDETEVSADCRDIEREMADACPAYPSNIQSAVDTCNEPEPYWAVGDGGMVFGVDVDGSGEREDLSIDNDLRGIACDGDKRAWVVGDGGIVLRTEDAGESWSVTTVPDRPSLRAVAQSHGRELAAVGDDGAFVRSSDGGETWSRSSAPTEELNGVAPAPDGGWLVTSAEGSIFAWDSEGLFEAVHVDRDVGLLAIAADHHGPWAAAVGEGGALLVSDDGGQTWSQRATSTERALHAVNVLGPNSILAVGERGTIVRVEEQGVQLDAFGPQTLLGLHVTADGTGGAVGERGRLLETSDGGRSWRARLLTTDADLWGLDQPLVAH